MYVGEFDVNTEDVVEFFFIKQKTAYEMRISDWSSDVCSADLLDVATIVIATMQENCRASAWGPAKKHALCCDCSDLFLNNPAVGTFKCHRAQDAGAIGTGIQADATGEFDNFFNARKIGRASCRERVCQYV